MPLSILQVVTKNEVGGAQQIVAELAKGLKNKQIQVKIASGVNGDFFETKLSSLPISLVKFKHLSRTFSILDNFLFIFEIRRFLNKNQFSAVHFHSSNALLGAIGAKLSRSKPKTIFTFHGLSYIDPDSDRNILTKKLFYLAFKIVLFFVDESIFVCEANLNYAKKIKLVKKGTVINNSVEKIDYLSRESARKFISDRYGVDLEQKLIIGSIGRLAYPKNYELFINAFPKLLKSHKNIAGILIGSGPERKKYENLTAKNNLTDNFFIVGEIPEAKKYIKLFDVFILTSIYEGNSLTLLEAANAGIPIIASRIEGIQEIANIKPEQIMIFNNSDGLDLIEKINKIVNLTSIPTYPEGVIYPVDKMINKYIEAYS